MTLQRRPLSRCDTPLAIAANPTVVHDFDTLSAQEGGPKIDEVSLYLNNPTGAPIANVEVFVGDGPAVVVTIAAVTTTLVLDGVSFRSASSQTNRTVRIGANGAGLVAFGWFTRG